MSSQKSTFFPKRKQGSTRGYCRATTSTDLWSLHGAFTRAAAWWGLTAMETALVTAPRYPSRNLETGAGWREKWVKQRYEHICCSGLRTGRLRKRTDSVPWRRYGCSSSHKRCGSGLSTARGAEAERRGVITAASFIIQKRCSQMKEDSSHLTTQM